MAQQQAKFLSGSLFRHVSVMSLTASVGIMAIFLVDFVVQNQVLLELFLWVLETD